MSAYMVDKVHIDALVTAIEATDGGHLGPLSYYWPEVTSADTIQEASAKYHQVASGDCVRLDVIGQTLWAENLASIHYRYPDTVDDPDNMPGPCDFSPEDVLTYTYARLPGKVDPLIVLDALRGYEYQSCEHEGWRTSEAYAICEALRDKMIDWLLRQSGRRAWSISDRRVFLDA